MLIDPDTIVRDFEFAARAAEIDGLLCDIRTETQRAPHAHPVLPAGFGAVYVFSLGDRYGSKVPAGAGAVFVSMHNCPTRKP